MRRWWSILCGCVVAGLCATPVAADPQAEPPTQRGVQFFESKIRPVLVEHCYQCHSAEADAVKGGLRVDTRAGLRTGGESGPAVVPGKADESLLIGALRHDSFEMPPTGKLPATVIADFETWVQAGAPDPRDGEATPAPESDIDWEQARRFWAYQPIRSPAVPAVKDAGWAATPIDRFILARLEQEHLSPSPAADRRTLIRRVYFDLIGLPPTPEAIRRFVEDTSPDAWPRLVDQLLASPQFGPRWGRHWLDVARYADSSGGGRELLYRDAWRYRDYVIDAFNRDKPFDRFMAEQVAGDLLPHASPAQRAEQIVATGFLVLGPTNYETQDKELLRMDVVDEQIDTIGRAFLGMTIGCARCHDHRFDPIPTADYYALAGILRSTKTLTPGNVSGFVQRELPTDPAHRRALDDYAAQVAPLEAELKTATAELKTLQSRLTGKGAFVVGSGPVDPVHLAGTVVDDTDAKPVGGWQSSSATPTFVGGGYLHDQNAAKGEKSITFAPALPAAGEYEVRLSYSASGNRAAAVPVTVRHADGEQTLHIDQQQRPPLDGLFVSLGRFRFDAGRAAVIVSNGDTRGHVIADAVQFLRIDPQTGRPETGADPRPPAQEQAIAALRTQTAAVNKQVKQLETELARLRKTAPPPAPMAMAVMDEPDDVGDYHICLRGNVHKLGPEAPRGFLTVADCGLSPTFDNEESGRRQLAAWLTHPDNPLPARVTANRIWHHLFGAGLVRTVDNFGSTGEPPSHPDLLDWLAARFIADGWSVKQTVRRIVLSKAYRQSSAFRVPHSAEPENRLLWRANRRRLEAEAIRDAVLAVSGRLDPALGGPAMKPGTRSEHGYDFDTPRRSVYMPVFRNELQDLLEVFDFPDPNLVNGRRNTSVLPTQALYLMNNAFMMDHARLAAQRLLNEPGLSDDERIDRAYRSTLGRVPTQHERRLTRTFVDTFTENGQPDPVAAWSGVYHALFSCLDFRYIE